MQKQALSHRVVSCSPPPPNQESKKPSMARQQQGLATATGRSGGDTRPRTDDEDRPPVPSAPEDFEFCILSSGGLALAGDDAADMCVADEVFSDGKLLPLRVSSAKPADAPAAALLLRSDSLDGAATAASGSSSGASSRSVSRSASSGSNSSSSSSVSRSASSKSAPPAAAAVPPRRSLSSSVFYAHPSPSPRPPRRGSGRSGAASAPRRSTGSAPPAAWGVIRLGVVGAPEVYAPRPAEYRQRPAVAAARLERQRTAAKESERVPADKKLALGLLGAGLVCSCSPDAVAPVGSAEVAAAEARRRRKKAEEKKGAAAKQSGRSRILEWLEELSISKEKSVV